MLSKTEQAAPRPDVLPGMTKKVVINDDVFLFLTVNYCDNGKPCEVFIRCDRPELQEWITLATILITRLLRQGTSFSDIISDMESIHSSGANNHHMPDGTMMHGMVSRLALELGMATT